MCLRTRGGELTALVLVFVCAASAWPVAHYGEAAEGPHPRLGRRRWPGVAEGARTSRGGFDLRFLRARAGFGRGDFRTEEVAKNHAPPGDLNAIAGGRFVGRGRLHRVRGWKNPAPRIPKWPSAEGSGVRISVTRCIVCSSGSNINGLLRSGFQPNRFASISKAAIDQKLNSAVIRTRNCRRDLQ